MSKLKKTLLIISSILVILGLLVIVFISPITKHLVEKYDEQYTGRQITMDWAYVNPFTGYIHFDNFTVYELNSDSIFLRTEGVNINIAMLKLLTKTYEISALTLNQPKATIIQTKKSLNFSDLIEKFSGNELSDTIKSVTHFNALNIKINDGEFHYHDKLIPINYFIKDVFIESTGKRWDADTIAAKFAFSSGPSKGDMKGDMTFNVENKDYRLAVKVNKFDMQIIEQYLKDLSNYGSFRATLDADMRSTGNLKIRENVTNSGTIAINDFHFGKNPEEDYVSFDKLSIGIKELSPARRIYFYDSVTLSHPYFKYERYDYLDNIQTMFGKDGSKIKEARADKAQFNLVLEIADYLKVLGSRLLQSHYKVGRLAILKGDLKVNDFSRTEKFSIDMNPFSITADSIDKNDRRVKIVLNSGIKPFGDAHAVLSLNPKDTTAFDLQYNFEKLPLSVFNPFTIAFTSFPMDRGTIEMNGKWEVRNGMIQSDNHLLIIDPRVGDKVKNKDSKWIPMHLVMAVIRERGNVIDYSIPITGNLKNPKFHLKDVILDVLKNVFVKPPTTPYGIAVKNNESEIEKLLTLKWDMRQSKLQNSQEKFIKKMVDFLEDKPEATINIYPQYFAAKEKEYILFFEAKKKYYLATNQINAQSLSEKDSIKVDKMSIKDTMFLEYLKKQVSGNMSRTIQDKCNKLVGSDIVNAKYRQLSEARLNAFTSQFKKKGVDKRLKISEGKEVVPYDGFSFYKIDYKGELPESLIKAHEKMNKLNDETPRKKFKEERKKSPPKILKVEI